MPFESSTVSCPLRLDLGGAERAGAGVAADLVLESGRWPRMSPFAFSSGSTHAWSIAFFFSSWSTHGGMRCTGSTTCALVTTQPRPSTNQPVPVSTNGAGFTVTGPWPQFIVISASTRAVTSATRGLGAQDGLLDGQRDRGGRDQRDHGQTDDRPTPPVHRPRPYHGGLRRFASWEAEHWRRGYNERRHGYRRSKTEANLPVALAGEADANRRYLAYGIQALNEGRPDIAQLFFEAAGAETIHALNHLRVMGADRLDPREPPAPRPPARCWRSRSCCRG